MTRFLNLAFLSVFFIWYGCERMETVEQTYPTYDAATKAGAVGRDKWIPDFLPQSATDIRERHNLDTNEIWLTFQFNSQNVAAMVKKSCHQVAEDRVSFPATTRSRKISWWPKDLVDDSNAARKPEPGYTYYQCDTREGGVLAVAREKNRGFYWSVARK
jgi:hypothetical protein